jgi:protein TonB
VATAETIITTVATGEMDRRELTRWGVCLLVVLLLHGVLALFFLWHRVPLEPAAPPPAVVMLDLAPLPAAPPMEPQPRVEAPPEVPPPPPPLPQVESEPIPEPQVKLPLEPTPAPHPEVKLPPPPPPVVHKPKPKPKPVERQPPVQTPAPTPQPTVAPPQTAAVPAPPAAAPAAPAASAASAASARNSWQSQVVAWLARYKRYPRLAQEQRQTGTVQLRFTIDRNGQVLSHRIERGSGYQLLDDEVRELIQRAQPLPAPPAEVPGARIELVVPVDFSLRR